MTKAELEWGVQQMRLLLNVKSKEFAALMKALNKVEQLAQGNRTGCGTCHTIQQSIKKYHKDMITQKYRDLQDVV
jgi:hypothetical protein